MELALVDGDITVLGFRQAPDGSKMPPEESQQIGLADVLLAVNGQSVNGWVEAGVSAQDNTYFATADAAARPVQFFEHKKGKLKTWDFDLATYSDRPSAASLYAPPPGCQTRCKSFLCTI